MISKLITWGDTRDHAHAADAPRARRIPGPRHSHDDPVLPVDPRRRRFQGGAVRHRLHRSQAGQAGRCRRSMPSHEDLAAIAAAVHLFTKPVTNGAAAARGQPLARRRPHGSAAMIFEVAIGDRVRTVGIVRKGGLLHVDVDGRTHVVDARRVNDSVRVDAGAARRRERAVRDRSMPRSPAQPAAGDFDVHLDGRTIPLQIRPAGSFGRQKKAGAAAAGLGTAARDRADAGQGRARARQTRRRGQGPPGPGRRRSDEDGKRIARRPRRPGARRRRSPKASRSTPAPCCWSWSSSIRR